VTGTGALATIVALWALHFAASGRLLDRYVEATADPILAPLRTVNGLLVSVAGLVAVAVANELVIAHPHGQASSFRSEQLGRPAIDHHTGAVVQAREQVRRMRSLPVMIPPKQPKRLHGKPNHTGIEVQQHRLVAFQPRLISNVPTRRRRPPQAWRVPLPTE
jgi:hypothetical protein